MSSIRAMTDRRCRLQIGQPAKRRNCRWVNAPAASGIGTVYPVIAVSRSSGKRSATLTRAGGVGVWRAMRSPSVSRDLFSSHGGDEFFQGVPGGAGGGVDREVADAQVVVEAVNALGRL